MKILVTGGAGFIGSHIVDAYIEEGHTVTILDNFSTGTKYNINPKADTYHCDIRDYDQLKSIIEKTKPEVINHHAALTKVVESKKNPQLYYEVNIQGTTNLLKSLQKAPPQLIIFASSGGAIYGDKVERPTLENSEACPKSPYGYSKLAGEQIVESFAQLYKSNYVSFRYANVYGPRQKSNLEGGVIPIFINSLLNNKIPTIFGNGSTTRDYIFIKDIVNANLKALSLQHTGIYNIGTNIETTTRHIYQKIAQLLKSDVIPLHSSLRGGEQEKSCLSNSKASRLLKWKPSIEINEGIAQTILWQQKKF